MPYITQDKRRLYNASLQQLLLDANDAGPGELNYLITQLVKHFWKYSPSYARIAAITGVLENGKQEFCRRIVNNYEDEKIAENGDVY